MASTIDIGPDLRLPLTLARERKAILGMSGSGKTNLLFLLFELYAKAGIHVGLIDPMAIAWGLAFSATGKANDLPVVILGGDKADLPVVAGRARELADVVLERRINFVLDLSDLRPGMDTEAFVSDFVSQIHTRKRKAPGLMHLMFDEAHEFAPQTPSSTAQAALLANMERFCKQVRNFGVGLSLASQQPQALNKKVLGQCSVVFAMHTEGPKDQDAVIHTINRRKTTVTPESLENLAVGHAYLYSPRLGFREPAAHAIHYRTTFDVPKASDSAAPMPTQAQRLKPKELAVLREALTEAVAEARHDDPEFLRSQIQSVERERARWESEARACGERLAHAAAERDAAQDEVKRLALLVQNGNKMLAEVRTHSEALHMMLENASSPPPDVAVAGHRPGEMNLTASVLNRMAKPVPIHRDDEIGLTIAANVAPDRPLQYAVFLAENAKKMPKGMMDMLSAVVLSRRKTLTRQQVGALSGIQASGGTFSTYLSKLKLTGYLMEPEIDRISATPRGEASVPDQARNAPEVIALWRDKLPAKAVEMIEHLVRRWPSHMSKSQLGDIVSLSQGGTFDTYLSRLNAAGLIEKSPKGIRADTALMGAS